jgi:hypothetical protein
VAVILASDSTAAGAGGGLLAPATRRDEAPDPICVVSISTSSGSTIEFSTLRNKKKKAPIRRATNKMGFIKDVRPDANETEGL